VGKSAAPGKSLLSCPKSDSIGGVAVEHKALQEAKPDRRIPQSSENMGHRFLSRLDGIMTVLLRRTNGSHNFTYLRLFVAKLRAYA
jgi:hypothetical protein